jgi:L-2-hydroxyglutarate oxidase LhgO
MRHTSKEVIEHKSKIQKTMASLNTNNERAEEKSEGGTIPLKTPSKNIKDKHNHGRKDLYNTFFKILGAGGMAQRLRALTALPEVLSSIPSNHMVAHNHL